MTPPALDLRRAEGHVPGILPALREGVWRRADCAEPSSCWRRSALFLGHQFPPADDPFKKLKAQGITRRARLRVAANAGAKSTRQPFQRRESGEGARTLRLAARQRHGFNGSARLRHPITEEQLALVAFQIDETKALAESLGAQAAQQQRQLVQREELYAKHLVATYRQALISPLEMLLSSSTLTEFANRVQQMIFVNRQDQQLANEIRGLRASTAAKLEDAAGKQKEILGLQDQIASSVRPL